ncbi:periplasmic flagellar collar protein FlcA [Spirochaeta isovalerica]|uniref:Tetratricopeptide (TPR) repeat protein n=1 Tax=Spirochaeta isovalerica TaxID=150 RepID=A0A841RBP9_9SPIO|nr:tetratricopeptide repeat protein [Spirochaeta isovalerica]MBB6481126.1 tetratricopeptide (TPR) repeat protein [Spirochaeta isovalerica]
MPDLGIIEDFKLLVNSLGKEPSIVAKEGGSIEDVPAVPAEGSEDAFFGAASSPDDFNLDDRLNQALAEDEPDELVPDLGGFDFAEDDDDNPFGDLGDFTLDDEILDDSADSGESMDDFFPAGEDALSGESGREDLSGEFDDMDGLFDVDSEVDNSAPDDMDGLFDIDAEPDDSGLEEMDALFSEEADGMDSDFGDMEELFEEEEEEDTVEELDGSELEDLPAEEDEFAYSGDASLDDFSFSDEEPHIEDSSGLPSTMGDLFEDGSEEAIPDFVAQETEEEELSFDDFTLDIADSDDSLPSELDEAEDLLPLEDVEDQPEEVIEEIAEELPAFDDDFDLSDEPEISLGDDIEEVEEIGDLELETGDIEDFDMSPGDFGDMDDVGDYSFGDELDAIDEMKEEVQEEEDFSLTEEQFRALKITMSTLPRNLKLAVEEVIAEQKLKKEKYEKFIMLLVNGASPKEIADYLLKTINRKIKLPSGYMKKSGQALEKSKSGFRYIFVHQTWPVLRWVLLGITATWIVGMLSLLFLYRPIKADSLYSKGYEKIYSDQYDEANNLFETAWKGWELGPFFIDGWRNKNWFYKYADAYRDRRQFIEAARKYDQLMRFYPDDIKGMMEYAHMETYDTANYSHAEEILRQVLSVKVNDYEAMLAFGDNYFEWSDEDPAKLEDARFVYATILDSVGGRDEILLRMLRYFLKRKDDVNIRQLKETFAESKETGADPAYFSKVFSELGGYLLDEGEPAEALSILFRAEEVYDEIPDVHYQLARYFRVNEDDNMEELALRKVLFYLDRQTPLKKDKIFMKLDTHRRRGELKFRHRDYLDAENEYRQGIALYENSINRNLIGASSTGGKLYADLGSLYYGNQDYMAALNMYDQAEKNRYITPEIEYHRGYCTYITGNYERALVEFYNAEQGLPGNRNILYALGNTMLKRGNYFGAQSAFTRVIHQLEEVEKNIGYLQIEEKDEHRALIEMYSKAYNNLGVAYFNLARSSADVDKISQAMVSFTRASDYSDLLTRDQETKVRANRPETFDSAGEYLSRDNDNVLDAGGYRVEMDETIHLNVDDVLF